MAASLLSATYDSNLQLRSKMMSLRSESRHYSESNSSRPPTQRSAPPRYPGSNSSRHSALSRSQISQISNSSQDSAPAPSQISQRSNSSQDKISQITNSSQYSAPSRSQMSNSTYHAQKSNPTGILTDSSRWDALFFARATPSDRPYSTGPAGILTDSSRRGAEFFARMLQAGTPTNSSSWASDSVYLIAERSAARRQRVRALAAAGGNPSVSSFSGHKGNGKSSKSGHPVLQALQQLEGKVEFCRGSQTRLVAPRFVKLVRERYV
ncbi:hypothetical protein ACJRO7_015741 [Eucalyptus globulus]|uniref:Uncharacterized protein n=1 Tax=Eucalyptus globulus TaxID=34317 RepID=A0ABD3L8E7_EUCGL